MIYEIALTLITLAQISAPIALAAIVALLIAATLKGH